VGHKTIEEGDVQEMKFLKPVLITSIIMAVFAGAAIYFLGQSGSSTKEFSEQITEDQRDESEERAYTYDMSKTATRLATSGKEKNVLNFDKKNVYNVKTSNQARERLDRLIKRLSATFEEPIIAANPFGTNDNSFYFYFETPYQSMVRYTITVEDESIPDFVRYVNNGKEDNLTNVHEFTVSGLVPGMTNYIYIEVLDKTGAKREDKTYCYDVAAAAVKNKLDVQTGRSKDASTLGLYFTMPKGDSRIYAYDNSGILRNITNTEGNHGSRFFQSGDSVLYQVSDTKLAKVSALGRVTAVTSVKGYGKILDFGYDGYDNAYVLVKKKGTYRIVSSSFQTGKTTNVYQFDKGVRVESITSPLAGSLYAAASKPNGIVKVKALTSKAPKAAFVLGKKSEWKNTSYKKKVHEDKLILNWNLKNTMLNLAADSSDGTNDVLAAYVSDKGCGTGIEFGISGKEKEAQEKKTFPVGLSGICLCQSYDGHTLISGCSKGTFGEYDKEGNVTKEFSFGKELDGVVKCSLNGMCFFINEN
jgi:hypothetical protein